LESCEAFLGITQRCSDQNAFVAVAYPPDAEFPRYLACKPNSNPDTFLKQAPELIDGIKRGVEQAFTATVPFFGPIVEGVACTDGVIFACAALAVDIANDAGVVPDGVAKDAVDLADATQRCANGDIAACTQVGTKGAQAAGLDIPGEDANVVADVVQKCLAKDSDACAQLGQEVAGAAGVSGTQ
jgi:hypothetical protein